MPSTSSLGGESNIKGKISDIYRRLEDCDSTADGHRDRIKVLEAASVKGDDALVDAAKAINDKIDTEVARIMEEMERKFSLQLAENKRLQTQLTSSKEAYSKLVDKVNMLEDRISSMEKEIGEV